MMLSREQIYFHYLQGPIALMRGLEQALDPALIGAMTESTEQQLTIEAQPPKIEALQARLARLAAQLHGERCRTQQLLRRIHELEAQLGQDSHNSNKPPSTDLPQQQRTRNLPPPSGRAVGGQPGHAGHYRPRQRHPDEVIIHAPVQCRGGGA